MNHGLRTRQIDVAIVRPPIDDDHLVSEPLFHEHFLVVLPKTSPLARRKVLSVKELADQVLLFPQRTESINKKVMEMCREAGVSPKITYTWTLPQEAGAVLVESGKGVYVLPGTAVNVRRFSSGIAVVPLEKTCWLAVHIAWRKGESAVAILNLVETARRLFQSASPADFPVSLCRARHSLPPNSAHSG